MRRIWWTRAALAAIVLIAVTPMFWVFRPESVAPRVSSVAVLPFDVLGASEDVTHLRAAMTDALTNRLTGHGSIRVPPAATISYFAKKNAEPFEIGRELEVEGLLTGTIQRANDRIRVTAQLRRVSDGRQVWTGTFEGAFTDIFTMQDAIAAQLAPSLVAGVPSSRAAPTIVERRRDTDNVEAYDLFRRGVQARDRRTPQSIKAAIAYFEQAIARDGMFANAWSAMSNAYLLTASGLPPWERFPKAKAAALRAIELDGTIAEAHTSLAFISYKWDWQWTTAEREFQRAIDLEPEYTLARHWLGEYFSVVGSHDAGISQLARARELDPYSTAIRLDTGLALVRAERPAESEKVLREALQQDPSSAALYNALSSTLRVLGRDNDAFEAAVRARLIGGAKDADIAKLRATYRKGGFIALSRADIAELLHADKTGTVTRLADPGSIAGTIARLYATIGDRENALRWLEEAARRHDDGLLAIRTMWYWKPFRNEPRFQAVERILGMP